MQGVPFWVKKILSRVEGFQSSFNAEEYIPSSRLADGGPILGGWVSREPNADASVVIVAEAGVFVHSQRALAYMPYALMREIEFPPSKDQWDLITVTDASGTKLVIPMNSSGKKGKPISEVARFLKHVSPAMFKKPAGC
jgi:hypothetical protein